MIFHAVNFALTHKILTPHSSIPNRKEGPLQSNSSTLIQNINHWLEEKLGPALSAYFWP